MSLYALPLKDPGAGPLDPARFLSAAQRLPPEAVRAFLTANPGYLARKMPLEPARALAAAADSAGFPALLVGEEDLPAVPPPLAAEKISPLEGGFEASVPGAAVFVPYDSIRVLCAWAYDDAALPDTAEALEPGLAARLAALAGLKPPEPPAPPKETFFRADIVTDAPGTARIVLRPENLDFSALGRAISYSSLQNFRLLLDALSTPAFAALKGSFLPAFLSSRPLAGLKAASEEAADAGLSRLILLGRARK